MTTEQTGSVPTTATIVTQQQDQSFLNDSIQLKKLLKDVTKLSKEAIDVLVECLSSKDEKVRFQAAIKILEFQVSVAKEVNSDQFQRMLAEWKLRGPGTKLIPLSPQEQEENKKKLPPKVAFDTIQQI